MDLKRILLITALATLPPAAAGAWQMNCFGIIAGRGTTIDGQVMMGHNEDEWGEQMPNVYNVPAGGDHCAYLWFEFPGLECGDSYMNEYGVCIASDGCPSREDTAAGTVVYDVRTEVARHARSAREGVRMIGRMVEEKGYRDSGRSYLIADRDEGWVCAVVRGRHWVAQRVPDDEVMVIPNHYVTGEMDLSDTLNFLGSPDIVDYAISRGWYDPGRDGAFNFSRAYADPASLHHPHNNLRQETAQRLLLTSTGTGDSSFFSGKPSRVIRKGDMIAAMSAEPILNDATFLSSVFILDGRYEPRQGCVVWNAFKGQIASRQYSLWSLGMTVPENCHRFSTAEEAMEKHFTECSDYRRKWPDHFFWHFIDTEEDLKVNRPDMVVYRPSGHGDTFNDHFHVIYDEGRRLHYAFWTQGTYEGSRDQHVAFSTSADGGLTWSDPVVLAGPDSMENPAPAAGWQQPMLSHSGRLYCLWNQQTATSTGQLSGVLYGKYSDDGGRTWSEPKQIPFPRRFDMDPEDQSVPPSWCNWQRPLRLGAGGRYLVGCSRHGQAPYDARKGCRVEFWQFENIDDDPGTEDIRISFFATDRDSFDAADIRCDSLYTPAEGPAVEEAGIVALPDGRLFALMRSSCGHPVWSVSGDGGEHWSPPKVLRDRDGGTAFLHPRSPCPIYDINGPEAGSGEYFALIHNTFDFNLKTTAYQNRGPLYMIRGTFHPEAEQPIWFSAPELFAPRESGNSFYTSYTVSDGRGILWFGDYKYYLLGRYIHH